MIGPEAAPGAGHDLLLPLHRVLPRGFAAVGGPTAFVRLLVGFHVRRR